MDEYRLITSSFCWKGINRQFYATVTSFSEASDALIISGRCSLGSGLLIRLRGSSATFSNWLFTMRQSYSGFSWWGRRQVGGLGLFQVSSQFVRRLTLGYWVIGALWETTYCSSYTSFCLIFNFVANDLLPKLDAHGNKPRRHVTVFQGSEAWRGRLHTLEDKWNKMHCISYICPEEPAGVNLMDGAGGDSNHKQVKNTSQPFGVSSALASQLSALCCCRIRTGGVFFTRQM